MSSCIFSKTPLPWMKVSEIIFSTPPPSISKKVGLMRSANQPTLADVAARAGVSLASVSRVLNDGPVSKSMRERVMSAMQSLGHVPDDTVSASKKSRGTIGVIIADLLNPYFVEMLRGVEEEAEAGGAVLTLITSAEAPDREQWALERLEKQGVDGIIISGSRLSAERLIEMQERLALPLVLLNRHIQHPRIACITVDLERATYRAAKHLLDLKHRRIAYLAGPGSFQTSRVRRAGIERALNEIALTLEPDWCPSSFPSVEGGFQAMSALLGRADGKFPTGVIAYNDMMALGALEAIRNAGLNVPDDISVVGFDDITMAAHANPPLTTISQPKYKIGMLAVRLLRQCQPDATTPSEGFVLLESPLIVRQSTGPVALPTPQIDPSMASALSHLD